MCIRDSIRRYVVMFGTLFNDIVVQRFNTAGARIQAIKVPIAYRPKEKFLARLQQNEDLQKRGFAPRRDLIRKPGLAF